MIAIISPAKSLDFDNKYEGSFTSPRKLDRSAELISVLRKKEAVEIKDLMSISDNLAQLNVERYHSFNPSHTKDNAKPCLFAFQGDVYQGLQAESLTEEDVDFAQKHLRILSGLYGLLRPLDLIQPYRLEMGTKLAFDDHFSLYDYWADQIAELVNNDLKEQGDNYLINLASVEYFKSIHRKKLKATVVDIEFKDFKNDEYKIISFYAKKARGLMSRFIIEHRIDKIDDLKDFDYGGYHFDPEHSSETKLAYRRGGH